MCYYRHHTHPDPLILPGLQDITTHVDFTAIARSADEANLNVAGYTTQAYFLLGCGLESIASMENINNTQQQIELSQQIRKLTSPSEMGEQFKVLALTKQLDCPLVGFSLADQRARLLPLQ
jgi:SAM-dependent MidA family methyltransferase